MLHPRAPSEFVLAPPQFQMAAADELPCDPAILHSFQGLEWMTFVHLQVKVSAINKATYRPGLAPSHAPQLACCLAGCLTVHLYETLARASGNAT